MNTTMHDLILKPARLAYPDMASDHHDFAVLHDGKIVGRIVKVSLAANEQRWTWSFRRQDGKGYKTGEAPSREAAMAAFRLAWDYYWKRS